MKHSIRTLHLPVVSLAASLLLASCERGGMITRHPVDGALPEATASIGHGGQSAGPALATLRGRLENAHQIATIGTQDGPEATQFGNIADLAVDSAHRIYVLDDMNMNVQVFDDTGGYLGTIGRRGAGPREFRDPRALTIVGGDSLVVVDRFNGVTVIGIAPGDTFPVLAHWTPSARARDLCYDGSSLLLQEDDPSGRRLHRYTLAGDSGVAVLDGYQGGGDIARQQFSKGPLACDPGHRHSLSAFGDFPVIVARDFSGQLIWASRVEGFEQPDDYERPSPSGQPGAHISIAGDHIVSLVPLAAHAWLAQVLRATPHQAADSTTEFSFAIRSYLVDGMTGNGTLINGGLPGVAAADQHHLYGASATPEEPWPRVVIYQY